MNISKINCGLVLLDFSLKKSPDSHHSIKPVNYQLLRINERYKSQENKKTQKKEKKTEATYGLQGLHQSKCTKTSIIRVVKKYNEKKD
jgi:hypothetical protein